MTEQDKEGLADWLKELESNLFTLETTLVGTSDITTIAEFFRRLTACFIKDKSNPESVEKFIPERVEELRTLVTQVTSEKFDIDGMIASAFCPEESHESSLRVAMLEEIKIRAKAVLDVFKNKPILDTVGKSSTPEYKKALRTLGQYAYQLLILRPTERTTIEKDNSPQIIGTAEEHEKLMNAKCPDTLFSELIKRIEALTNELMPLVNKTQIIAMVLMMLNSQYPGLNHRGFLAYMDLIIQSVFASHLSILTAYINSMLLSLTPAKQFVDSGLTYGCHTCKLSYTDVLNCRSVKCGRCMIVMNECMRHSRVFAEGFVTAITLKMNRNLLDGRGDEEFNLFGEVMRYFTIGYGSDRYCIDELKDSKYAPLRDFANEAFECFNVVGEGLNLRITANAVRPAITAATSDTAATTAAIAATAAIFAAAAASDTVVIRPDADADAVASVDKLFRDQIVLVGDELDDESGIVHVPGACDLLAGIQCRWAVRSKRLDEQYNAACTTGLEIWEQKLSWTCINRGFAMIEQLSDMFTMELGGVYPSLDQFCGDKIADLTRNTPSIEL